MTNTPPAGPVRWGRGDATVYVLAIVNLALITAQFALAGFGAFTMDKTPGDNAYGAHAVVGLLIAAATLVILVTVLVSPAARARRRTLRLAVSLAVLSVALQPLLGDAGTKVPVLGALHALNAVAISFLACWLTWEMVRRRRAVRLSRDPQHFTMTASRPEAELPGPLAAREELAQPAGTGRGVAGVAWAALGGRDAGHHLAHVLPAPGPGGLAAFAAGYCSAHDESP